jgi:hypothetical protein
MPGKTHGGRGGWAIRDGIRKDKKNPEALKEDPGF